MKIHNKPMKHGTYRHYRRHADGTLVLLGEVHYDYPAEATDARDDKTRDEQLAWRDANEQHVLAQLREQFENWVDHASEGEG